MNTSAVPAVSVVIANYNQDQFLVEAIESVLNQTYQDFEIIVCDDGSTDNSASRVEEIIERAGNDKVRLLRNEQNQGVSYSRNRAARAGTGKYIAFLDADDRWQPDKLDKQMAALDKSSGAAFCFTGTRAFADDDFESALGESTRAIREIRHWERAYNCLLRKPVTEGRWPRFLELYQGGDMAFSSIIVSRRLFDTVGGFRKFSHQIEDMFFKLCCFFEGDPVYVDEPLTEYRCHPDSFTQRILNSEDSRASESLMMDLRNQLKQALGKYALRRVLLQGQISSGIGLFAFIAGKLRDRMKRRQAQPMDKALDLLIYFVTSACNLSCSMCFYADNLNTKNDLKLSDHQKIMDSLPETDQVLITGGEPFMNRDLKTLALGFLEKANVSINSNGTYTARTLHTTEELLEEYYVKRGGTKSIAVSISLDGLEERHNEIRKANCFQTIMETLEGLTELKHRYRLFSIHINSVITSDNYGDLLELARYLKGRFDLDYHNFEIERPNPGSDDGAQIDNDTLKTFYRDLLEFIGEAYPGTLAHTRARFSIQYLNKAEGALWPFACEAGKRSLVIFEDGRVNSCEVLPDVGHMRDYEYDVGRAMASASMATRVEEIKSDRCDCTHGCWVLSGMQKQAKATAGNFYNEINKNVF